MKIRLLALSCALYPLASCSTIHTGTASGSAAQPAPQMPTASEVIARLKQGNRRFATHHQKHPDQNGKRIHQLATGQHPIACILACADSRVPPEIIFDQGLGDLFVVREAGHVADDATQGSLEYALEHLKTPVIVVLGHESCGAVTAALDVTDAHQRAEGEVQKLVEDIRPAILKVGKHGSHDDRVARGVTENVKLAIRQLNRDPMITEALKKGTVKIIGGVYDLHTGRITWL